MRNSHLKKNRRVARTNRRPKSIFATSIAALFAETQQKYRNVCYEKKVETVMHGQQSHQYQQNEQSHLTISLDTKTSTKSDVGNPGPSVRQTQICGGIKPVNGIPTLPY